MNITREDINSQPRIDLAEFSEFGYLQEVNRLFLHPLGLAMVLERRGELTPWYVQIIDGRSDPEGVIYSSDPSFEKWQRVYRAGIEATIIREKAFGWSAQPVPGCDYC